MVDRRERLFLHPPFKILRACVEYDSQNHDNQQNSKGGGRPCQSAQEIFHDLKIGSDAEMNLPGFVSPGRLEGKTHVQPNRTHRRCITHSESAGEFQVAYGNIECVLGDLAEVDKNSSI